MAVPGQGGGGLLLGGGVPEVGCLSSLCILFQSPLPESLKGCPSLQDLKS